ncbi:MAG: type II secretion system protein [Desulfobacteraceae bacterium]|nr:type II secretion system protein [Desulfobacteraceae bacterium]
MAPGFTLIELMVVMLLITIMFAVTIPRLSTNVGQDPRKRTTRWLMNTISALRSAAMEKQKSQILVVDLDEKRFYVADAEMNEEAKSEAAKGGFALPSSLHLIEVQYPNKKSVGSGTAEIVFYPGGFSEQAAINMETDDNERFCFKVEPLLPRIKVVEDWIRY